MKKGLRLPPYNITYLINRIYGQKDFHDEEGIETTKYHRPDRKAALYVRKTSLMKKGLRQKDRMLIALDGFWEGQKDFPDEEGIETNPLGQLFPYRQL